MKLTYTETKHWKIDTCFINNKEIEFAYTNDGTLVMFDKQDIIPLLDEKYPHNKKVWWFNETHDREIAERRFDRVICNPQVLWRHCKTNTRMK